MVIRLLQGGVILKERYIIKKIIMGLSITLLVIDVNLMVVNSKGSLFSLIAIILLFIHNSKYFKEINYENKLIDSIVFIASIISFIYIILKIIIVLFV